MVGGFWTSVAAAIKATMDDFEDGDLAEWDRVDSPWSAQTTYVYEGSYAAHADNTTGSSVAMHALEGSLAADFAPGQVYHFAFREVGGLDALNAYFAKQDTTLGTNWYRLQLRVEGGNGGVDVSKDVDGVVTEFMDNGFVSDLPSGTAWGHAYVMWDTDAISGDPDNADGDPTGDFYVEVQDDAGVPKFSAYVDASDTTYRGGGVGFLLNDTNNFAVDKLEAGDLGAFDSFTPGDHVPAADEIAFFEHADFTAWTSSVGSQYTLAGSGEVSPAQGDTCLKLPGGTGFREDASAADGTASGQQKTLPNYIADGESGRVAVRTDDASIDELYVGCALADTDNYLRCELDWGDQFRILEFISGTATELASDTTFTGSANTWYDLTLDRTTAGQVTFDLDTRSGTNVASLTVDPDTSLDTESGLLIGGSNTNGPTFYYDDFRKL